MDDAALMERAVARRDVDAMSRLIAAHVTDVEFLRTSLFALQDVLQGATCDALSAAARGALLGAVLAALRLHAGDAHAVELICFVLVPRAFIEGRDIPACKRAATSCGLAELLVSAMRRHAGNASVQDAVCAAITEALEPRPAQRKHWKLARWRRLSPLLSLTRACGRRTTAGGATAFAR
jgi:hypothetical protein